MNFTPCNPNASPEVRAVLNYLSELPGKGIITGQHTQTKPQEELTYIQEVTGKSPALCGFELLGYSPNINFEASDEECLKEVNENKNTLEEAWKWAEKKGLITFTWHWFSPVGGVGKAFYAKNTDFNVPNALIDGTEENKAFISDMDEMAEILKKFQDKKVPILWRPFHEADGDWFWWGNHGPEVAKKLYRFMYDRYTNVHHLNNLIWVWNSPLKEGYVGDDVCDVISRDMYPPAHQHSDHKGRYEELVQVTPAKKIVAIAEIGTIPSIAQISESKIPWTWFMTWSKSLILTEDYTTKKELYQAFNHEYSITLDKLPKLY